jgi:hypothetical protein
MPIEQSGGSKLIVREMCAPLRLPEHPAGVVIGHAVLVPVHSALLGLPVDDG